MIFSKKVQGYFIKTMYSRADENGTVFYFSAKDFDGLSAEPFEFLSRRNEKLRGYFYHYDVKYPDRIIIFEHGIGGGHRSYMKEIELIARHGYLVFSYDHTGCMESEGENTNGFVQSLSDLDACIDALEALPKTKDKKISVVGHSWGGFSALNICALHPEVDHIVAISGYISAKQIIKQKLPGWLAIYRRGVYDMERKANPSLAASSADASLKNTDANVLIIHSDDDKIVGKSFNFDVLKKALAGKENVRFLEVTGKGHNPNYTFDAVQYMREFFKELQEKIKGGELITDERKSAFVARFDWDRMTAQDENVWAEIFKTLDA